MIVEFLDSSNFEIKVITGIPNYPSGKIYKNYGFFKKSKENYSKEQLLEGCH